MIPILTDTYPMTGNGLGGLSDAIECKVTDEVNGEYELVMKYPVTGEHYSDIQIGYIVMAEPMALATAQPFRVYRITKPLNGVVTIYARHISYDMSGIIIEPCTAASLTAALTTIPANAVPSCPFTLASSRTVASAITVTEPKTLWSLLGGSAGSFLDVYGGEWEFDGMTATLKTTLGTNRGVEIRYGKNLTQLENDSDTTATYGGVYPFWYDDTDGLVTLTEGYIAITGSPYTRILLLDCTDQFDSKPSENDLRTYTNNYITNNAVGSAKTSWKISFALLAQSGEYDTQAILEQVQLGDTIKVKYDELGIDATARAVKTEWDVLGEKYISVTVGRVKQNLASILVGNNRETTRAIAQTKSALEIAIQNSTNFIKNGTGVMRFIYNSSGDLMEIVSLDDPDLSQAVSVWRWNNGGFGHSSTGYSGNYTTAITQDGQIVADFITTGTLNAARVKAGILSDNAGKNSWDLDTGSFSITDGSINITTNNESQDIIQFNGTSANGGTFSAVMQPISFEIHNDYPRDTGSAKPQVIDDILISSTNRSAYIWVKRTQYSYNNPQYPYRTEYVETGPNHISLHRDIYQLGTWTASATSEITPSSFVLQQPRTLTDNALVTNLMSLGDSSLTFRDLATAYERIKLDNSGLTFRDSSNVVTASYPSYGLYAQDMGSRNLLPQMFSAIIVSGDITFTPQTNGSVYVSGTATSTATTNQYTLYLEAGDYIISTGSTVGNANSGIQINGNNVYKGSGTTFTQASSGTVTVRLRVQSGDTHGEYWYPMIRPASITDSTYYPYAMTNRELTEYVGAATSKQSLQWSTATSWASTGLSYVLEAGYWYMVEGTQSYDNAVPSGVAIVRNFSASTKYIYSKTENDNFTSGRAWATSALISCESAFTIQLWAKAASAGVNNTVYLRVRKMAAL